VKLCCGCHFFGLEALRFILRELHGDRGLYLRNPHHFIVSPWNDYGPRCFILFLLHKSSVIHGSLCPDGNISLQFLKFRFSTLYTAFVSVNSDVSFFCQNTNSVLYDFFSVCFSAPLI
jgi:hypothetical protein